jgi:hypothetical protein
VQHLALAPVHPRTSAFAPVVHLGVFDTDASVSRHSLDQTHLPFLIDLPRDFQGWLSQFHLFPLERLHPGFHRLQHL